MRAVMWILLKPSFSIGDCTMKTAKFTKRSSERMCGRLGTLFAVALPLALLLAGSMFSGPVRADVLAHWDFEESAQSAVPDGFGRYFVAADAMGNYDAWRTSTSTAVRQDYPGQFGSPTVGGIRFAGGGSTTSFINIDPISGMLAGDFTIAGWIKPETLANVPTLFADWGSSLASQSFVVRLTKPDSESPYGLTFILSANGSGSRLVNGTYGSIVTDQWQHVAVTYDQLGPTTAVANWYVNGSLAGTQNVAATSVVPYGPAGSVYTFARDLSGNTYYNYNGLMDEFWVFDRALTSGEIGGLVANNLVPEPTGFALLACAGLCVAWAGLRQRRAR